MENRVRMRRFLLFLAVGGCLVFLVPAARAYHDQGNPCYVCHSLKPAEIRPGSNAIRWDQPVLTPVRTLSGSQSWTGGMPITCDFCHKAPTDVPTRNFAVKAHRHPVRTIMDNGAVPNEIACGDCHNRDVDGNGTKDLTPESMTSKSATDGYPDHDNMSTGSYDNHLLSLNPPHLTVPYWSPFSLPGANRSNDTTFWTNVRNDAQDIVCWVCHQSGRTAPMTGASSALALKQDYVGTGRAKGHQIQTNTGGSQLGVGAAMPCYNCHDSHGSVNRALILDDNSIYGSATSQVAVTTFTGTSDLVVCAQCHDTGNSVTKTTKDNAASVGKPVEGIHPVDPYNSSTYSTLHIDGQIADNMLASPRGACLANNGGCHASPHNPLGESVGGDRCGLCHGSLYASMAAGKSSGYHHVMLADNAPVVGVYPTNSQPTGVTTDRTCLICHVDHNYFSPQATPGRQRSVNLRRDITAQPDNGANAPVSSDFDNALSAGGICTSCHTRTQTKRNPGTDIKQDGSTTTPVVGKSFFGGSAHNYPTVSPFIESRFKSDNTLFQSNCVKCHNDTAVKKFQDNTAPYDRRQFSLHASDGASAVNKLLAPLGYSPLTDNLGESFCYRCHSRVGDLAGGKITGARDWYDGAGMDNAAESTYGIFRRTSRHPVATADQVAGSKVVNCLNCHNVHLTRSASGGIVSDPDNTYSLASYNLNDNSSVASIQNRAAFCLKCHKGSGPAYQVDNSIYVPATVYATNSAANKWTWGRVPDNAANSRGHWNVSGQLRGGASPTVKACDACHDKHGSTARKLLGVFDPADGVNRINGVGVSATVTAADNAAVCYACHTASGKNYADNVSVATYETYRDATGYFSPTPSGTVTTVRWPGKAAFDCTALVFGSKQSPHGNTSATGPASLGSRAVADCNGCHDPHGTAYTYNMLTDNMTATTFKLCFDCHGLSGSPSSDNIARYFPTANGGLSSASTSTTNVGHNVKTSGGLLNVGNGLPCYDCHMTHGSTRGNSQLKSDQRWASLGNTKYGSTPSDNVADNNSRTFCLGCHVASDDAATTGTVENLQRQTAGGNRLKIPATPAGSASWLSEHSTAGTQGCQRCHYGRTYLDNTYGPHYPSTGLCDTCHESQGTRSASPATYNGAHRTHTDNALYGFACKQCHTWTGTLARATHKNDDNVTAQHAEVVFDNQAASGWLTIQYATATQYEYRSMSVSPYGGAVPAPGPGYARLASDNTTPDNVQSTVRWTNGTCSNVWCHSNANPVLDVNAANRVGVSYAFQSPSWLTNSLSANCTGCHGGDATSGRKVGDNTAPTNGSIAHRKHIDGNIGCSKCHYYTVKTTNNRQIDNLASHLNGSKDVWFDPASVGGTWDNATKTCASTYCHGNGAPRWDNIATVTGCGVCHQNQGAGASASTTGTHHPHTNNAKLKIACETCHANKAASRPLAVHAGGPDNSTTGRTAEIRYTDNGAAQSYDGFVFLSRNLWSNPFDNNNALTPIYVGGGSSMGNDAINPQIHWTAGSCQNVWCHSNAKPLSWKGIAGGNRFTTPSWTANCIDCHNPRPTDVNCTACHSGVGTAASMAGTDNLSNAHGTHAATDRYAFTCDECHAWTVMNDQDGTGGFGIIAGTGHDNHVDGVKTVKFGTTLRTTTVDQSGGAYDNSANRCYNTYCHSNGTDNAVFNTPVQWPRDNTIAWNSASGGNCTTCHGGSSATGSPITSLAHDNHVGNTTSNVDYECRRCHTATVNNPDNVTITSYANHVNARKDVAFLDNAAWATYTSAGKSCSNTFCHRQGNKALSGGADNLTIAWDCTVNTDCRTCHGSKAVSAGTYTYASKAGEPNYDNGAFGGSSQNSHYRHMQLPGADNTTFCYKCHGSTADNVTAGKLRGTGHLNDNVEVVAGAGSGVSFGWTAGTHTCSNISCHGGTGNSAVWGASLGCQSCHAGTGDLDDFGSNADPSTFRNNGRIARVDDAEWTTRGHGATSNYAVSNFPGAGFTGPNQCLYCHNGSVAHDNTSNIFRLANYNVYGNGWNDVCLVCHRKTGGHAGYNGGNATAAFVDNSHYGAKHTSTYNGGKFCYDCHDPHGDNNIFMVGRRVTMRTDNTYGIPYGTVVADNTYRPQVNFQGNTAGANYADNTTRQGICQVCHTTGVVNHWTNSAPWSDGHNAANKCTTCHLHDAAFKGLGGPDVGQYFDRLAFANYPDNSSHPLRGLTTVDTTLRFAAQGSENCLGCHYGSGSGKTSDECLMCHFENVGSGGTPGALDGTRHMDQQMQLATISGNSLPTSAYAVASIQNYDSWCLQCHGSETGITLGGISPLLTRRTVIDPASFANGRHRAVNALAGGPVGCVYCHQPHGRSNARIVRENPSNRASAGATPMRFGVYPADNVGGYTGKYRAVANDNYLYRARTDNTLPNVFADADDDQNFCAKACHAYKIDPMYAKDKMIKRDGTTGNYVLAGTKKIFLIGGAEYTNDNIVTQGSPTFHGHVDGDIIPTDNMVKDYATLIGMTGPSYYQYPLTTSANPSAYSSSVSDLPFFPDPLDGTRDFTNAWNTLGVRVKYRFTCSTCHNPHGTSLVNTGGGSSGYPDLRLPKTSPSTLCARCHK